MVGGVAVGSVAWPPCPLRNNLRISSSRSTSSSSSTLACIPALLRSRSCNCHSSALSDGVRWPVLAEEVAGVLRANLFETRLRGHGLPGDSMGVVRAGDWLDDAVEALEVASQLGDSLVLIGTSTGGTLATWLATHPTYGARVHRLVLISPNFGVADGTAELLTAPWAEPVLSRLLPWREWAARTPEQGRYWTTRYPSAALFPMQALVEVVRDKPLTGYRVPTLLFVHANDQVVDATRTAAWVARLRAESPSARVTEVAVVPKDGEDGHVVVGRILAPSRVIGFRDEIVRFVR